MSDTPSAAPPIVFGTDGWRASIGEDYTYDNVRRCAQGVAEWVIEQGTTSAGVVVGYDRRFASEYFAGAAAGGSGIAHWAPNMEPDVPFEELKDHIL